jgi:hypothetical protein
VKRKVELPSKRILELAPRDGISKRGRARAAPLFSELVELVRSFDLTLSDANGAVDVESLALADFHALRAIATKLGWLEEETFDIDCRNCDAIISVAPCAALELGPFVDRELGDPELDTTLDLSIPHPIPDVSLTRGRVARDVVLAPRTVGQAAPLFRALRRRRYPISASVVRGMGIERLGDERDPVKIALALERCDDAAWDRVAELYLDAHYPLRLSSIAICPSCGARNDVDAPDEREFFPARTGGEVSRISSGSNAQSGFPTFEVFDATARSIAEEMLGENPDHVALIVEGGVPACDDGGEPLLGSYEPEVQGDPHTPSRSAQITVFFRTFRVIWEEDGPYDWRAELEETIEHELEHHTANVSGHDPVDEAERKEIDDEAVRVIGKRALARSHVSALGTDLVGFLRRTWLIWLVIFAATLLAVLSEGTR